MDRITFDQIRGPVERVVLVGVGYIAAKGWIRNEDVANFAALALAALAAGYGWWQNRPKAIIESAQALPSVVGITTTDKALAADPLLPKVTEAPQAK